MMIKSAKLKIGQFVTTWTTLNHICSEYYGTETEEFEVLGFNRFAGEVSVMVEIPSEWTGWNVNKFHIEHCGVFPKKLGARFYEIPESMIL